MAAEPPPLEFPEEAPEPTTTTSAQEEPPQPPSEANVPLVATGVPAEEEALEFIS